MKKFRKIMAVLVAAIMVVAMTVPAWAEESAVAYRFDDTKGSISVENTSLNEKYNIYKIFDLASFADTIDINAPHINNHTNDRYAYVLAAEVDNPNFDNTKDEDPATNPKKIANPWINFFSSSGAGYNYIDLATTTVTIDEKSYYPVLGIKTGANGFNDPVTANGNNPEKDFAENALYSHTSQAFARAALDYATTNNVAEAGEEKTGGNNTTISWGTLPLGYYLVSSTLGTLVSLDTTNLNPMVKDKNVHAVPYKHVQEDQSASNTDRATAQMGDGINGYRADNDADIGDIVYYRNYVKIGKGATDYEIHDAMGPGLTLITTGENAPKVYVVKDYVADTMDPATGSLVGETGEVQTAANGLGTAISVTKNFTLTTAAADLADGCDFEIVFENDFLDKIDEQITKDAAGEYSFVVLYAATLNPNAVVGEPGNVNTFTMKFGDAQSVPVTTTTYTWGLDLFKYWDSVGNGSSKTGLPGAQFQIKRGGTTLKFIEESVGVYRYEKGVQNWDLEGDGSAEEATGSSSEKRRYRSDSFTPAGGAATTVNVYDTLKSPDSGLVRIYGLDGFDYTITETLAPVGFFKLQDDIYVHIDSPADTDYVYNTDTALTKGQVLKISALGTKTGDLVDSTTATAIENKDANTPINRMVSIQNYTTNELPSTGGMGTTVLYIVGGMLVILAGAYLFFSRKRTA